MKTRISRYLSLMLLLLPVSVPAGAQGDLTWADKLESARKLYYSGSYYAAEKAFDALLPVEEKGKGLRASEVEAYKVLCAIALDRVNVDGLVKVFSDKYPNAPELSMIKYSLASNYFERGLYAEAADIFAGVEEKNLYRDWRTEYRFKRAFSEMTRGNLKVAAPLFESVVGARKGKFTYPALYYLGYVYYLDRRFADAYKLFVRSSEDSRFKMMSDYYALESKFMTGDHYYVSSNGDMVYAEVTQDLKPNVARMLSESNFAMGETTLAQRYMDTFEASGTQMSRKDYYYSGMLAHNLNSWERALGYFSKVTEGEKDSLCQSALYYEANSYLNTGNKIAAMKDFKAASEMAYDKVISEDALFNFAKLSFDVNSDISQFSRYQELYPGSARNDVIYNYMAMAFVGEKDYASAVDMLRKISKPDAEVTSNLQKASFLRAMQLIEGGAYRSAVPMLELSVANGKDDPELSNLASFWDAECLFRDGRYREAVNINKKLISDPLFRKSPEYPMSLFNQGYCCFKDGDYAAAAESFTAYLNCADAIYEKDALIRLADCWFMENAYDKAASAYQAVCDRYPGSDDLYPNLQAAISYGLSGNETTKLQLLKDAVANHAGAPLYPQALYELGLAYVQAGKDRDAAECFQSLQNPSPDNAYFAKSTLALAMISTNVGQYNKSIEYYKKLLNAAPESPEAQDALVGLENVYGIINRPAEYLAYIDEKGLSSLKSEEEREKMLFNSAEQLYRSGNYATAMNSLQDFVAAYPSGANTVTAQYYLAETLRRTGRKEAACDMYREVIDAGGMYKEPSLSSFGQLSYELEHYQRAAGAFSELASLATMDDVRCGAFSGLMRSRYRARQMDEAVAAADSVLTYTFAAHDVLREAKFIKAKALASRGDRDAALAIYKSLISDCSDAYGAESAYQLVLDAYNCADHEAVEQRVFAFSDTKTPQVYWLAKSFLVLGDSYFDRGETEQAEATWKSVAEGYKSDGEDDIAASASARLSKLQMNK